MKNDRCAINLEIFLLDILSYKGAITECLFDWLNFNSLNFDFSCIKRQYV